MRHIGVRLEGEGGGLIKRSEINCMINKKLLEILRLGILEIRLLSSNDRQEISRINKLANILHNIPKAIEDCDDFNFAFLKEEIVNYKKLYHDGVNFLDVLR